MSTEIIELWHKRARPVPTDRDFNVQMGCHLEEIAEMLAVVDSELPETRNALNILQLLTMRCCEMHITNAIDEVNKSNWSKFDSAGQPIFNEHGKIMKGPNYREPDLSAFV